MVDPWSSMDSSNSPLTDSGPSASDDCTPSTSSEPARRFLDKNSLLSPDSRLINPKNINTTTKTVPSKSKDNVRSRNLTLDLDALETDHPPRRPHFLDEDYQPPSNSSIECRIPKPHFLDSPSPDELDERSDITNPNFLDDEVDGDDAAQKKVGALPKRSRPHSSAFSTQEERPHRTSYRSTIHYGLESALRSNERDKRASQLFRGTWPGERDIWTGHDSSSVRSFSSNGSNESQRPSSNLDNKMDCVFSLISLLSLSPENNADLSAPLLEMSKSVESCIAMRQAGCIPLLVQLIHSKVSRDTRDRAAKALRNIIHTQTDDKAGRREARVWRLLEQVREYCYVLEDIVETRKDGNDTIDDDATKHPSQSVAALMKLSFDEEHRHVVCQLGGLQTLAALVSGDQVAHGSSTDDNTCLTMRKYAGMTLTNLTFGDGNNKSLLCSFKEFMLALVEQLESPNDDMRQVTAAVLRNLSWRADTNSKLVLREVGAVKGLTKAAMTCQKEATLKSVLSALWNLTAHCSMNKVALCSVGGALGFLVDMLSYNSPTKTLAIVENAGGIMRNVSSHIAVREDYRQILRERNCLSVLLQHLKSPSLTVVSNSCGTLWNLSARCPQDQEFLWDHGAVPMLRSLIHSKHKMIAMGSSAALKNLLNSKPGKTHIIALDTTARSMNLPTLPTLGARKQKALEQELDQNLAETCDNIEPATSPTTNNREEKNLFTATERKIAMNFERHRMTSSSPLMGTLSSQISLSHSAHLASYLSCSNTLLKGAIGSRSSTSGSSNNVNRSDSKDSVTSTHSDSVFERVMRTGKVPVPTPRSKDLMKLETHSEMFKIVSKPLNKDGTMRFPPQPPIPPPRSMSDSRTNFSESGYDVDQDSCDQPVDYSRKYSETKRPDMETLLENGKSNVVSKKYAKKENTNNYGDYQETDLDQPTDYSLRYAEHQSETGSDSEPPGASDTIKHFATEGTPYETPIIFSTATSMSDLRVIGKDAKQKSQSLKEHPEVMTHSDEKDTCSLEDPPRHNNDLVATTPQTSNIPNAEPKREREMFDTKFSSGMISPEKPINYCDEGTPGYFSRVSSLSSVGEPTEEDNLAKKNAKATINPNPPETNIAISGKDKEGCKAVTFAQEEVSGVNSPHFVNETPLMFSRSSSLGSLPDCSHDDQGSVLSEFSRLPSGCISPSEVPDSAGHSVSHSPRPPAALTESSSPADSGCQAGVASVFEERVSQFVVEHTPALLSHATSLSSLTIDDGLKARVLKKQPEDPVTPPKNNHPRPMCDGEDIREHVSRSLPVSSTPNTGYKGTQTPSDVCKVYFTEDTPALLSKAGSNSNLSALSIDSTPRERPPTDGDTAVDSIGRIDTANDTSDSSNLSDAGDLLEECIQKGIAKVVKNKGPPSDMSNPYTVRSDVYRSLPPYLRSSTETVKMCHEFARTVRDSRSCSSERTPPLPPKLATVPPPRPPPPGAEIESGCSSRSASFGSADREIFEETVRAGLARGRGLDRDLDTDQSDLSNDSFGSTDKEVFERCVRAGMSQSRRPRSAERRSRNARGVRPLSADRSLSAPQTIPAATASSTHLPIKLTNAPAPSKNEPPPSAARAPADDARPARDCTGSDHENKHNQQTFCQNIVNNNVSLNFDIHNIQEKHVPINSSSDDDKICINFEDESVRNDYKILTDNLNEITVSKKNHANNISTKSTDSKPSKNNVSSDLIKTIKETTNLITNNDTKHSIKKSLEMKEYILQNITTNQIQKEITNPTENHTTIHAIIDKSSSTKKDTTHMEAMEFCETNSASHPTNDKYVSIENEIVFNNINLSNKNISCVDSKLLNSEDQIHVINNFEPLSTKMNTELVFKTEDSDINNCNGNVLLVVTNVLEYRRSREVHENIAVQNHDSTKSSSKTHEKYGISQRQSDNSSLNLSAESIEINPTFSVSITSDFPRVDLDMSNESYADIGTDTNLTLKVSQEGTQAESLRRSNEELAPRPITIEPPTREDLNCSNESYADVTDGTDSDIESKPPPRTSSPLPNGEITVSEVLRPRADTWEDHTCPDDETFPTINGSFINSPVKTEALEVLPDLVATRDDAGSSSRPDLTKRLDLNLDFLAEDNQLDSIISSEIEKEAAQLAAQLKNSQLAMENSVTSLTSLDLDNVRPPSNLGSLLSLSVSGHWEETSLQVSKKSQRNRKKSLPVSLMVKRALSNSMNQGSSEHLDSNHVSFLDNVKPPSEMDNIDMEGSMVSVSSIISEVVETQERTPVVFDLKQPIQDFPHCNTFTTVYHDLDKVNPPSLFDQMPESTIEVDPLTAQQVFDDYVSHTLNVMTDIPSGSENCTPLPSDISSVDSTPKRQRDRHYLTPKEKRHVSKDRYQTYTITDSVTENEVVLEVEDEFLTWTKSESDRSEEYVTASSETKSKKKVSAKQRRLDDRARYQTQTVNIQNIVSADTSQRSVEPHIQSLKQRLAAKKTMKQKRIEDAERFRTRTLSEDIPPSPTFVTKDANFENVETTTGYDSLSSNELNHQLLTDERQKDDDVFPKEVDSGHNEDDFELNSMQMQTYTKSFRNYLPVIESPAAVDMCVVNNLKNMEMTALYKRSLQQNKQQNPSSSDLASYEGDSNSEDKGQSESDQDTSTSRPKPKILKPNTRCSESFDSNESLDKDDAPTKAIRGRKKAMYVSPYRRNAPKLSTTPSPAKTTPKVAQMPKSTFNTKSCTSAKIPCKTPTTSKPSSANTSPKKAIPHRSPTKTVTTKPVTIPLASVSKHLPLERQGTFTKEESSMPAEDLPVPDHKTSIPQYTKVISPTKPGPNTSPSRLPQLSRYSRQPLTKTTPKKPTSKAQTAKCNSTPMKNSPSNNSLQSNDSGKTVTLTSRSSRQGSTSSVNSVQSSKTASVESKIANLWKKVEATKKQPCKPDKRVWIESDKIEAPKLIRSSTFEGQPKQVSNALKQKSAIGIKVSHIPSLRPMSTPAKISGAQTNAVKKPTNTTRVFTRKQINRQVN